MISEGSCDTEDRSNDAENSALITGINYILEYIKMENSYLKMLYYFAILLFLWYFWSTECSLDEHENNNSNCLYTRLLTY